MKIIPSSRRCHYLAIVSTFSVMLALIAGMVGCTGAYLTLTVDSTKGGSVTEPGEGTFSYSQCCPWVDLVAEAEEGYIFVEWTGDADSIDNANAATTSIWIYRHLSITANFERMDGRFAGGTGTEENPLQIANWHHLHNVRVFPDNRFILMHNLDSTTPGYEELAGPTANQGKGWEPIGTFFDFKFRGSFDGQGYEIRDLFINRPDDDFIGLFGSVVGSIKNVGVVNVTVIGNDYVGGLIGYSQNLVSNSYSTGNVTGYSSVGGLVGSHEISVSNSYSTGSVTGYECVGGLVGRNRWGTVDYSYSAGSVTGESTGGLVGWNEEAYAYVSSSFWDTETSGQSTSAGGTGKNTTKMQDIATFLGVVSGLPFAWNIIAVALNETNPTYIWNIVNNVTYPFLSWES